MVEAGAVVVVDSVDAVEVEVEIRIEIETFDLMIVFPQRTIIRKED